jgi:hypothetical protein
MAGRGSTPRTRHIAVGILGLVLTVIVTDASVQDREGACRLLVVPRERLSMIALGRTAARGVCGSAAQCQAAALCLIAALDCGVGSHVGGLGGTGPGGSHRPAWSLMG